MGKSERSGVEEKSIAAESRAVRGAEDGYGSAYVCSICPGCLTGPGTARDEGRDAAGRFHTCLPLLISGSVVGDSGGGQRGGCPTFRCVEPSRK